MKQFSLVLLLILSGILFEILCRPLGRFAARCRRLPRLPARSTDRRRSLRPTVGEFGSVGRTLADDAWRPAAQF